MNERLVVAGMINAFDAAVKAGDRGSMIDILSTVAVADAAASADAILADPTRYGY